MRTTVRIDDDLMEELKELARQQGISMAQMFNRAVRFGIDRVKNGKQEATYKPFKQKTHSMGVPKVDLTKANQIAAELEDEEIIRKMRLGK